MADDIAYSIIGDDLQVVEIELNPDQAARGEIGTMMYMDEGIDMQTSTGGGVFKGLKRMITGESFFISAFKNTGNKVQKVGFGAAYPGKVIPLDLAQEGGLFFMPEGCFPMCRGGYRNKSGFYQKVRQRIVWRRGFCAAAA